MAPTTNSTGYSIIMPSTREGMKAKAAELIAAFRKDFTITTMVGNSWQSVKTDPQPITILREMRLYKASCRTKDAKDQWEEEVCHLLWPGLENTTKTLRSREQAGYEEAINTAGSAADLEIYTRPSHKYKGYRQNSGGKKGKRRQPQPQEQEAES